MVSVGTSSMLCSLGIESFQCNTANGIPDSGSYVNYWPALAADETNCQQFPQTCSFQISEKYTFPCYPTTLYSHLAHVPADDALNKQPHVSRFAFSLLSAFL
jgi:hypothetical protein